VAVPCQGNVPPTTGSQSQLFSSMCFSNSAFFSADPDAKHICIASKLSKGLAQAPGIKAKKSFDFNNATDFIT
jgi:hypothetical protein